MEGWAELFKHFLSSKLSSACLLVAATVLCLGPTYVRWIPAIPDGWKWVAFGVMIFTASQCTWWTVNAIFKWVSRSVLSVWKAVLPVRIEKLSKHEKFLLGFAAAAGGYLDLNRLEEHCRSRGDTNAPDMIQAKVAASNLIRWGLIDYTMTGDYHLTDMGNRFVLKYQEPANS